VQRAFLNVDCSRKSHKLNEALQIYEDQKANSNQAKSNVGYANDPFKVTI